MSFKSDRQRRAVFAILGGPFKGGLSKKMPPGKRYLDTFVKDYRVVINPLGSSTRPHKAAELFLIPRMSGKKGTRAGEMLLSEDEEGYFDVVSSKVTQRGKGLGPYMYLRALKEAKRLKLKGISSDNRSPDAQKLWEKIGTREGVEDTSPAYGIDAMRRIYGKDRALYMEHPRRLLLYMASEYRKRKKV
jgi:hypothetical protein